MQLAKKTLARLVTLCAGTTSETNYDLTMPDWSQSNFPFSLLVLIFFTNCYFANADGERKVAESVILEDADEGENPFSCMRCGRRY